MHCPVGRLCGVWTSRNTLRETVLSPPIHSSLFKGLQDDGHLLITEPEGKRITEILLLEELIKILLPMTMIDA